MTSRIDLLDKIGRFLTEELGAEKVTRRPDGILIVAGETEAYAIQTLTIDAPDGIRREDFGEHLVKYIEGNSEKRH